LAQLNAPGVSEQLLAELRTAAPEVKAELARVLAERSETSVIPELALLAGQTSGPTRKAALDSIGRLAGPADLKALTGLLLAAGDTEARSEAKEALNNAVLLDAYATGSRPSRISLLSILGNLRHPTVRATLRESALSQEPAVRIAGIQALAGTSDPELLGDLLIAACGTAEENLRTLCLAGTVRLVSEDECAEISTGNKLGAMQSLLALPLTPAQKRLALSGLGAIRHEKALQMAIPLQAASDRANVTLKPGWNPLMLKVTQNNLGWEFCARFIKPDGSRLEGLRMTAEAHDAH
jgi:HEAT repeat protein